MGGGRQSARAALLSSDYRAQPCGGACRFIESADLGRAALSNQAIEDLFQCRSVMLDGEAFFDAAAAGLGEAMPQGLVADEPGQHIG